MQLTNLASGESKHLSQQNSQPAGLRGTVGGNLFEYVFYKSTAGFSLLLRFKNST